MQHAHQLLRAEKSAAFDFAAVDRAGDAAENHSGLGKTKGRFPADEFYRFPASCPSYMHTREAGAQRRTRPVSERMKRMSRTTWTALGPRREGALTQGYEGKLPITTLT